MALLMSNINHILFQGITRSTWYYCFPVRFINTFTRRFWWCLAAIIGVICLTVSLSLSIPAIPTTQRERSRLGCKKWDGNRDMYGIGIRIATYVQVVMTTFGEVANPTYTATLATVNLWFLWALITAMFLSKDDINEAHWRDVDLLMALGNAISYINLGALLLPAEGLDLDSVFTRLMRWATLFVWYGLSKPLGIALESYRGSLCDYD